MMTCSTGEDCTAPVPLDDRGQRVWGWVDLVGLVDALAKGAEHVPTA